MKPITFTATTANFLRAIIPTLLLAIGGNEACRAEQFVLFDTTFTYTKEDADNSKPSKSHYYVKGAMLNEDRPKDWTSPVDYRNGTVHVRLEVIEKPKGIRQQPGAFATYPTKVRRTDMDVSEPMFTNLRVSMRKTSR